MQETDQQYQHVISKAKDLFVKKTNDYGTAWRILRSSSLTDQIFIKAQRIRTIQETGENKVGESIQDEFVAIINYCIMALIQLEKGDSLPMELGGAESLTLYNEYAEKAFQLMQSKNHDYGEAWRDMRVSSLTDLILMKLLRVKQIENNAGKTLISEGIDANYYDMLNYAVFALILLDNNR